MIRALFENGIWCGGRADLFTQTDQFIPFPLDLRQISSDNCGVLNLGGMIVRTSKP
jgi:hypothetical protein